jgi:hypothetical protein
MITERDYIDAAQELGCEVAAVKAVADVESSGDAFLPNGEPKILFEAHHFSRLTNHEFDVTHARISSKKWNRKLYIGGAAEHFRLQQAVALNREAALQSASWGMFQIMGFNWKACGFKNVQQFVNAMCKDESSQFKAFVGFVKSDKGMLTALQKKKWAAFAEAYNGPGYKENKYDVKLEQAYKRHIH